MNFVVKSETNGSAECSFLTNGKCHLDNYDLLDKVIKTRPQLFEFILDILSNPRFSLIMSWEGTNGQFAIRHPDEVARLWGERNGRRNMTYEKFSRALRYYYHKNVLTKIRGRKYAYKFDLRELERQYGYFFEGLPFPATSESNGNGDYEILATGTCRVCDVFPAISPSMMSMPHESQDRHVGSFSHTHYFPF